ncbi:class I SAM-dependent methyltransferase [Luteimonas suaedae]|uniref:class I SAM-dependent methyltransferase n=1 Tax=Luteimonas suaedae TaxID=2605430 RepID=UPI001659C01F|nr:class I SAM-dependent methyltransferase [Luteimonas suaedae]
MESKFNRLVRALQKRPAVIDAVGAAGGFSLRLKQGPAVNFGGASDFTVVINEPAGLSALSTLDVTAAGEAYLAGALDVEGNIARLLAMRDMFSDRHPLRYLYRFVRPLLFGQVSTDKAHIAHHYDEDPDFFRLFLDTRHRCYSQGVFTGDDDTLEDAITRKLRFALDAIAVKPGDRVLDIGGGWGAFTEFAGRHGLRVTSLTISQESEAFIRDLIDRQQLPCEVRREHLFEHRPEAPYDAIVNLGVTEHLPDYPGTLKLYLSLLRPGGRVYLDASAARTKHAVSDFFERHIFRGNGSQLCLHEYLEAVSRTPFEIETVLNDRHNYGLTCRAWAERLDAHRAAIEARWGRSLYRRFQLYLWGCVDGFDRDLLQAYRWVLRKPD